MPDPYYPKMTEVERVTQLVHMHFEPGRIARCRARIEMWLAAPSRSARHADYKKRLEEYDARLLVISKAWTDAPDVTRASAHAAIDQLDAHGEPRRGVGV